MAAILKEFEPENKRKQQLTLRLEEGEIKALRKLARKQGFRNMQSVITAMVRKCLRDEDSMQKIPLEEGI